MRIVFTAEDKDINSVLSMHFGRCPYFIVVENGSFVKAVKNPYRDGHEPGDLPKFIAELQPDVVISGRMGSEAKYRFEERGVKVIIREPAPIIQILSSLKYGNKENILEIKNLKFKKNGKEILKGVSISLFKGEVHSVIGVNGTGKTTLSSIIMGLHGYSGFTGSITFKGQSLRKKTITERAKMGITMAWQNPAGFEGITVREYLSINNKSVSPERALRLVGLEPGEYLDRIVNENLSGGERKRIELAAILCFKPELVLLDEPDSGIDMASMNAIRRAIRELREMKTTVLIITHNERVALFSDRASLMCDGKIIKTGIPEEVTQYFKTHCRDCNHINEIDDGVLND